MSLAVPSAAFGHGFRLKNRRTCPKVSSRRLPCQAVSALAAPQASRSTSLAGGPNTAQAKSAMRLLDRTEGTRCRDCLRCGPAGRCLHLALKSGRCGDWVWYVLQGRKQCRRRWVKPKDPRSLRQRRRRGRLGAASGKYSRLLTDEQRDGCIAAGAKVRSRVRLGQWGWLTGQQYWVGKECAAKAEGGDRQGLIATAQVPQTQRLTKHHPSEVRQRQGITRSTWDRHRSCTVVAPWWVASGWGGFSGLRGLRLRECGWGGRPGGGEGAGGRRWAAGWGRGPPEKGHARLRGQVEKLGARCPPQGLLQI